MRLDVAGIIADAWRRVRRDADILLPVAGLFHFLPLLGIALLVADPPRITIDATMDQAARMAAVQPFAEWLVGNTPWFLGAAVLAHFGTLTILTLYLDRPQGSLGEALARALRLFPRFFVLMLIVGLPLAIGYATIVLLVPALYLLGRLLLIGPALIDAPRPSVRGALRRSVALSRGNGFALAGVATLTFLGGLLAKPFQLLARAAGGNPVAVTIAEGLACAVLAASLLALALLQVAAYRRLARNGT